MQETNVKIANNSSRFVTLAGEIEPADVRVEKMQDKEYLVAPVIALVEGVLSGQNSDVPELALAEVFGARLAGWNGRPVVMSHPQLSDGTFVSANSPDIQDEWTFGQIFDALVEDNKLKVEAWIDVGRAGDLGGDFADTVERLQSGEIVEVSVGVFVLLEETSGIYDGEEYGAVWLDITPDHLALLPEGVLGACSNEDGCGTPRVNKAVDNMAERSQQRPLTRTNSPVQRVARNNNQPTLRRVNLVRSDAQSACSCGGEEGICTCTNENTSASVAADGSSNSVQPNTNAQSSPTFSDVEMAHRISASFSVNALPAGRFNRDIYRAIADAISATYKYSYCMGYTIDYAVYEQYSVSEDAFRYYKVPITVNDDLSVEFTGDPVPVKLVTSIIEESNSQETDMTNAASGGNPSVNASEEVSAEANASAALDTPNTNDTNTDTSKEVKAAANTTSQPAAASASPKQEVTVEQYIENAPAEIREILSANIRTNAERKQTLIKNLMATNRCQFSETELNDMNTHTLERMATLAAGNQSSALPTDYSGLGVPQVNTNEANANAAPPAPLVFERKIA